MNTIADFNSMSNNLNLIKFVASLLVIFSHAHTMIGNQEDILFSLSKQTITLGGLAVVIFLFASGYFVTKSLLTKNNLRLYFKTRFLRIYPLFIVVIILTAFVLGPIVTFLTPGEYFSNLGTYKYFSYLICIPNYSLPGVFTNNTLTTVNGSLWTLILEIILYIALAVMYKLGLLCKEKMKYVNILFVIAIIALFVVEPAFTKPYAAYLRPAFAFAMGVNYYIYRDQIKLDYRVLLLAIVLGIPMFILNRISLFFVVCFPYILSMVIFSKHQVGELFGKLGNYSYAIYLVAFPIQQMLIHFIPSIGVLRNTLYSCILSIIIGVILYYAVEKPMAKIK